MSELQIFSSEEFGKVRVVERDGEPWFVGKDVAEALGYKDTVNALKAHVDSEDKAGWRITTQFGMKETTIINESGVYALVFGSKLPSAKEFKRWVTSEVLPAIRKHDGYLTAKKVEEVLTDPDTIIKLATAIKEERAARVYAELKLEEAKPKVLFADAVSASKTSILIGDMAKLLKQNGHEIGQKRLFQWLRENGYLIKRLGADYNSPTQWAMEKELFEIKETTVSHADGHISITKTTKVTGKGQVYFVNLFAKKGAVI